MLQKPEQSIDLEMPDEYLVYFLYVLPGDYMLPDTEPEDWVYTEIFTINEFYKIAEQCLEDLIHTRTEWTFCVFTLPLKSNIVQSCYYNN